MLANRVRMGSSSKVLSVPQKVTDHLSIGMHSGGGNTYYDIPKDRQVISGTVSGGNGAGRDAVWDIMTETYEGNNFYLDTVSFDPTTNRITIRTYAWADAYGDVKIEYEWE